MAQAEPTRETERLERPDVRIGAVVSRYHAEIGREMLERAREELVAAGLAPDALLAVDAPGAFELPLITRRLFARTDVAAVMAFGLVLRGETTHDRWVAGAAADGLLSVSLECDKPVLFGVLTCDTIEQARERARAEREGGKDKGAEVARACVAALNALARIEALDGPPGPRAGFLGRPQEASR